MTAKDFFSQALNLDMQLKSKHEQIRQLRDLQFRMGVNFNPVKTNSQRGNNKNADISDTIMDLTDEYVKDIIKLLKLKYDIKTVIDRVEHEEYRTLLEWRYINLFKWENIAERMHYNERWMYKLHLKALRAADEVIRDQPSK